MSSGAGKYLESLDPVLYYTFDTPDSMESEGVYYFFNSTPYDFPFISPMNSSIYNDVDYSNPTSYSLSIAERTGRYRSYSSSKPIKKECSQIYYEYNSKEKIYERKTRNLSINTYSRPILETSLPQESIDLVGDQYTIMLQMRFRDMGGTHSLGNLHFEEMPKRYDPVTGLELEPVDHNDVPIDTSKPQIFPATITPVSSFYYDVESFRFLDIGFVVEAPYKSSSSVANNNYTTIRFYAPNSTLTNMGNFSFNVPLDDVFSIALIVTNLPSGVTTIKVRIASSENEWIYNWPTRIDDMLRKVMKLGFISRVADSYVLPSEHSRIQYRDDGYLRTIYSSSVNIEFDNFAVFNRHLTTDEIRRYHALNYDVETLYTKSGFSELYDFKQYYDKEATNHIQTNNVLRSIIGNNYTKSLIPSCDDPYTSMTVKRYIDSGDIEYSLQFSKKSMLYDMPYFSYYASDEYRFVKNESFTVSFFFKTTDMNGLLYSYSRTVISSKNILFIFKEGSLQIWHGQELKREFSGYNDGKFHHFVLANDSTGFSFYIDGIILYSGSSVYESTSKKYSVFGNGLPHLVGLEFELALLAYAPKKVSRLVVTDLKQNSLIYESTGLITLNNIRVGTTVLIYDHYTGNLLERLKSSSVDGVFVYTNRYPYTISVVVNDDAMLNGRSYIVSPVEIE